MRSFPSWPPSVIVVSVAFLRHFVLTAATIAPALSESIGPPGTSAARSKTMFPRENGNLDRLQSPVIDDSPNTAAVLGNRSCHRKRKDPFERPQSPHRFVQFGSHPSDSEHSNPSCRISREYVAPGQGVAAPFGTRRLTCGTATLGKPARRLSQSSRQFQRAASSQGACRRGVSPCGHPIDVNSTGGITAAGVGQKTIVNRRLVGSRRRGRQHDFAPVRVHRLP